MEMQMQMTNNRVPEEIMMTKLSRLPVKSLVRFRCVCKFWFMLLTGQLSDPIFTDLHLRQLAIANPTPILIQLTHNDEKKFLNNFYFVPDMINPSDMNNPVEIKEPDWYIDKLDDFWDDEGNIKVGIYGICNGLVCIRSNNVQSTVLYVWNPMTRDNITISSPPFLTEEASYGFGFCQATKEYKVIRVVSLLGTKMTSHTSDQLCQVDVYTLGTNTWRTLQDLPFNVHLDPSTVVCGALVNGALHWVAWEPECLYYEELVSFDLETETFKEIFTPECILEEEINFSHVLAEELGGLLAIFRQNWKGDLQIWIMQEYGIEYSWTKQFAVESSQVNSIYSLQPLCVASDGAIVLSKSKLLVLLKPETNSTSIITQIFGSDASPRTYFYEWSLVSPKHITTVKHNIGSEELN